VCKIGQIDRCGNNGCEWSKHFNINCSELKYAEKVIENQEQEKDALLYGKFTIHNYSPKIYFQKASDKKKSKPKVFKERRKLVYQKNNSICYLCDKYIEPIDFTIDHVIPRSKGGTNDLVNLMPTHKECNYKKGNKILKQQLNK